METIIVKKPYSWSVEMEAGPARNRMALKLSGSCDTLDDCLHEFDGAYAKIREMMQGAGQ